MALHRRREAADVVNEQEAAEPFAIGAKGHQDVPGHRHHHGREHDREWPKTAERRRPTDLRTGQFSTGGEQQKCRQREDEPDRSLGERGGATGCTDADRRPERKRWRADWRAPVARPDAGATHKEKECECREEQQRCIGGGGAAAHGGPHATGHGQAAEEAARRSEQPVADLPGEQTRADGQQGRSDPSTGLVAAAERESGDLDPVHQRRFFDAKPTVERRHDPVVRVEHGQRAGGILGLIVVPEGRTAQPDEQHDHRRGGNEPTVKTRCWHGWRASDGRTVKTGRESRGGRRAGQAVRFPVFPRFEAG